MEGKDKKVTAPEIDYPCRWSYRVIGADETVLRKVIAHCAAGTDHEICHAKNSSAGRYVSLNLEVVVHSEEIRLKIYHTLADHPSVKIVL